MTQLPDDIARTLDVLLPEGHPLRAQVPHLRVESRCRCGCSTALFAGVADGARSEVVAEAAIGSDGEVLLFADEGRLSWLEVCSWTDPKLTLADVARFLRGEPAGPS
ncbi:hypothetical protein BX285_0411 [Streptomyces sp. 1114.5]|uniref:hypothetical protein n=1 Tax=unclassified Streptomyces TaxID=2593676 RepID=UPI000BC436B9|nr:MULTISPECIES: hypothetical protein [unclassified Streptomyces]RKT16086.1 hypothetical protein BX285_0411 [Streptomyces sp. 1114.5]SOB82258.1 hypothetical protein SAMN06272789_2416 [Streptomyces sp. 1331.2]